MDDLATLWFFFTHRIEGENVTVIESSVDACIIKLIDDCWHPDPNIRLPCNTGKCENKRKGEIIGNVGKQDKGN